MIKTSGYRTVCLQRVIPRRGAEEPLWFAERQASTYLPQRGPIKTEENSQQSNWRNFTGRLTSSLTIYRTAIMSCMYVVACVLQQEVE